MSQGGEKRPITKPSQITPDYLPKGLQFSIQQESALSLMFTAALCRILNLASFLNILNNRWNYKENIWYVHNEIVHPQSTKVFFHSKIDTNGDNHIKWNKAVSETQTCFFICMFLHFI